MFLRGINKNHEDSKAVNNIHFLYTAEKRIMSHHLVTIRKMGRNFKNPAHSPYKADRELTTHHESRHSVGRACCGRCGEENVRKGSRGIGNGVGGAIGK